MNNVKMMSSLQKDFVASFLRSQLVSLRGVLETIENSGRIEGSYVKEFLNRVEKELRQARKLYLNN
ncbi:MAG: hypothetical protein KAS51_03970 [Candidatus Omnitrophica bacterium]|nr:hypothetical protein [Candidatus Omnitrophota bacterium]